MPRRLRPPTSTLVLLVRHGLTPSTGKILPGRARGLHLSDQGATQAESVAQRMQALNRLDALYSSPLERARETAAPTSRALRLKVTIDRGLNECDFGEWTGKALKDLGKLPEWNTVQRYPSGFRFPGGESFAQMQTRIVDSLAALTERHRGEVIACFSHADPIKAAVAQALGAHLDLFQRIMISPCSITAISYGVNGPAVLTVNSSAGSLADLKPS